MKPRWGGRTSAGVCPATFEIRYPRASTVTDLQHHANSCLRTAGAMVCMQLEGGEDALTVFRCLSTVSVSRRRHSSKYVHHFRPPHRAHREFNALAALARELFRHRPQGVAEDHGQIPHPPLGQGRRVEERNRHGPHSRIIDNEDRKRRAARSTGQHTQIEGYGHIQRKAARYGSACTRTEDKNTDQHCEKVEQGRARWLRASANVRRRNISQCMILCTWSMGWRQRYN